MLSGWNYVPANHNPCEYLMQCSECCKRKNKMKIFGLHIFDTNAPRHISRYSRREDPAITLAALPPGRTGTALHSPRAGQGWRAALLAKMKDKTSLVQRAFGNSAIVTTSYEAQPAHAEEVRQKVEHFIRDTLDRFEKAGNLLYEENPVAGADGIEIRMNVLQELNAHLACISEFASGLNPNSTAADNAQAVEADPTPARTATDGPDGTLLDEQILEKSIEVVDALAELCIATHRPQTAGNSIFNHYFKIEERFPIGARLEEMLVHAALAQTVYSDDLQANLEKCASHLKPAAKAWAPMESPELERLIKNECPKIKRLADGRFYDRDSGLVMQIFENAQTRQATVAFGGTSAGEVKGPLITRLRSNAWITLRQWRANFSNATGIAITGSTVPDCYSRGAGIARAVKQHLATSRPGERWSLSLTGHSKGAAEAAYAALVNELPAVCFGTPQLGEEVLRTASAEQLEASLLNIKHYFVQGDLAPTLGDLVASVVGRKVAHVGSGFWMKPADAIGHGPLRTFWCHESFLPSAIDEATRQRAAATA